MLEGVEAIFPDVTFFPARSMLCVNLAAMAIEKGYGYEHDEHTF